MANRAMHLTQVGRSERGSVRSTSRSAWGGSDVLRICHALRLGLRPQPRSVPRAGVKCIAQFRIENLLSVLGEPGGGVAGIRLAANWERSPITIFRYSISNARSSRRRESF